MVERIFLQVSVAKRENEVTLDNKDFDERAHIYRRKKWIEDDLDPDEMEAKWKNEKKDKFRKRKAENQKIYEKRKQQQLDVMQKDDRFKDTVLQRPEKPKKRKSGKIVVAKPSEAKKLKTIKGKTMKRK